MRRSTVLCVVIILEALCCFGSYEIWGHHHITESLSLAWAAMAFVAALVLGRTTDYSGTTILAYVVAGALLGDVANIVVDISLGTSSHDLFPLELAVRGFIGGIGAVVAIPFAGQKRQSANAETRSAAP